MRMVIKKVDIFICQEYTDYDEKVSLMRERRLTNMIDWIIGAVVVAAVAAVIVKKVKDHKAGKSGCGCGCSGCSSKGKCH